MWAHPPVTMVTYHTNKMADYMEESVEFLSQDHQNDADLTLSFMGGVDHSTNTMENSTRENDEVYTIRDAVMLYDCAAAAADTSFIISS